LAYRADTVQKTGKFKHKGRAGSLRKQKNVIVQNLGDELLRIA